VTTEDAKIDATVTVINDLLKVVATFEPGFAVAIPIVMFLVNREAANIKAGLAAGEIIPTAKGDYVSTAWAADPRHQLNPDGSFRDKSW
jgi:hypothetical protein